MSSNTPSLRSVLREEGFEVSRLWGQATLQAYGLCADCLRDKQGSYVEVWKAGVAREFRDPDKLRAYIKDRKHGNS